MFCGIYIYCHYSFLPSLSRKTTQVFPRIGVFVMILNMGTLKTVLLFINDYYYPDAFIAEYL